MNYGFLQPGVVFFSQYLVFNISLRYFENLEAKSTVYLPSDFSGGCYLKVSFISRCSLNRNLDHPIKKTFINPIE